MSAVGGRIFCNARTTAGRLGLSATGQLGHPDAVAVCQFATEHRDPCTRLLAGKRTMTMPLWGA
jgi:hypothetical protein